MTREQIERASVTMKESQNYHMSFEDAQDYISKCGFDIPWNDGDVFVDEREITRTVGNVLKWRINSVWHSTDELPQHSGYLAVLMENRLMEVIHYTVGIGFHEITLKGYTSWAYVLDLLPERKEETNGGR